MAYNKKAVLAANAEAIRVVLRLEKEHRMATEAEKRILRGYQGFGGLKCVLNRTDTPADIRYWSKSEQELFAPTQRLKQMIYREAVDAHTAKRYWESIKASVLTSFYTDRRIVSAISDALATSGATLKRCLDPSSGMGAFAETFAKQVGIVDALEKDLLTARISQALHPYGEGNIFVRNEPFEAIAPLEETEKYDLVTSNIPFGDFMVYDREYSRGNDLFKKESTRAIHNYFFVKGEGSIYYTYNNGKLANDPKLTCLSFFNALERIPKAIESHEKEIAKVSANKEVYTAIANSSWKEEDLCSLNAQAAGFDRKIGLTLSPSEEEKKEDIQKEVGDTEKKQRMRLFKTQRLKVLCIHLNACIFGLISIF